MLPQVSSDDVLRPSHFDLALLARDLLGGRPEAEDVAQDVWLLLRRQPPERVRSPGAWLRLAIVHTARRVRQRNQRRAERERIVARADRAPSVLEQLELKALREQLIARVDELGEPYREVIRLRYLEEREIEDVAARVGRSQATVRSQLTRGLDQLRARMGGEPNARRRLAALVGWPWLRAALASGIAAGALAVTVLLASGRSERGALLAAAPPALEGAGVPLEEPLPSQASRSAVPVLESPGRSSDPKDPDWGMDVEGDVLDPEGVPVADAAVLVGSEDGGETRVAARSDANGHYRVRDVDGRLLIWADGQGRASSLRHLIGSIDLDRGLDLSLGYPLGSVAGRVLSSDGKPVPGADVALLRSVDDFPAFDTSDQGTLVLRPSAVQTTTASDGSFRLPCLPGEGFWLRARAEGHPPRMLRQASATRQTIEIALPAPCLLEGRLLRPGGAVAARARLQLAFGNRLPTRETTTSETGRFRFDVLPPAPFVLSLLEDPTGGSASCYVEGKLEAGEEHWQEVTLDEGHSIRGRAIQGDRPLGGWIVELVGLERAPELPRDRWRTRTAADGGFVFRSCCLERTYQLRLLEPGGTNPSVRATANVRAGDGEIALRASASSPPGSLKGRIECVVPGLTPVIASLRRHVSPPILLRIDGATGEFSATGLPPDDYNLRIWVPRVGVWTVWNVEILPGQRRDLVVELPEPGTLQLHVELPEAASWDELEVALVTPSFHEPRGQRGLLRLRGIREQNLFTAALFPGDYRLQATVGGTLYENGRGVHVESGRTTHEVLSLLGAPVILQLSPQRPLLGDEEVSLSIQESELRRSVDVILAPAMNRPTMALRLCLGRDTKELRVDTSSGLSGTLAVTEADLVPGRVLSMKLEEAGAR